MKKLLFPTLLLSVFILTAALHPVTAQDSTVVVTINISTSGDDMPIGAEVTLANHDGLPEHTYTAISPPDGIVVFPEVFIGTYDLSVDLFGYQPYRHYNIDITQDMTLYALLLEIPFPPPCFWVDLSTYIAYWCKPGHIDQTLFNETWDSGNFSANEWTFDPDQGNWAVYSPNDPLQETYARFNFWPQVTDYSYSLVSKNISRYDKPDIWLSFDLSFSNFLNTTNENLAVEVWNGLSWTVIANFSNQDYPEGIPWTTYIYNITDTLQESPDMRVRFRAWGQDSYSINWWGVDNINIHGMRYPHVLGYYLYFDEVYWTQDTTYQLPPEAFVVGETYTPCVEAIYPSGPSDMVCFYFTVTNLQPPRNLEGEDVGHTAYLTWEPPLERTRPYKSGGMTWDELLAYNNLTEADLHHPSTEKLSCGLPPPGRKPIHLVNPNGTSDFDAITSRAFAYDAYSTVIQWDYPVKFFLSDPGDLEDFGPFGDGNFFSGACWGPNDVWYVVRYYGQFGTVDTATGDFTQIGTLIPYNTTGLAWDPTTQTMYMCSYGDGGLWTVDPETGSYSLVGYGAAYYYIDMTCTNEGQLYALDMNLQAFGTINKTNGAWTPLISLPFAINYAQGMSIDREEDKIYWAAYNNDVDGGQLWIIDLEDETMYYLGDFEGQSEIDGMVIPSIDTIPWNLIGYNIYRDGCLIDSTDAETTEYYDEYLLAGWYSYEVTACYSDPTPGESQAAGPVMVYIEGEGVLTGEVSGHGFQPTGVIVTLIFGDSSVVISDSTGHFSLVVQEGIYNLHVEADGCQPEYVQVFVPYDQTVSVDIILMEGPPPLGISAVENESDTSVLVHWYLYQDVDKIKYNDGEADNVTAWNEGGNMNAVRFTPTNYPAEIYGLEVNIYNGTWPPGNILTPFKMAIYDDDGDYGLPGTVLAISDVTPYKYGWVYADFSTTGVTITNGDFYGVMIQGGDFPDCSPIAVDTTGHARRSYSQDVSHGEPWRPSGYNDFMMQAYIHKDMGNSLMSDCSRNGTQNRDLEYFKLYVLPEGEEQHPDTWILKNDNLTQTNYTDVDWGAYPAGWYRYAVIAVYPYNESFPAFSSPIEQVSVGMNEPDIGSIKVYPIPAKDIVTIEVNNNIRNLKIINYTGQVVYEQRIGEEKTFRINTSGFRTGSFLIEFISDDGRVVTRKMVIVK